MSTVSATLTTITDRAGAPRIGVTLTGLQAHVHLTATETLALADRLTESAMTLEEITSEGQVEAS